MPRKILFWIVLVGVLGASSACQVFGGNPTPTRQISYDGPVTLTIQAGQTMPGTTIAYYGKAPDGRALMDFNGVQALKATADSVNWTGALVLFSLVDLKLRVVAYDETGITLAGTIHLVVQEPNPTPGELPANRIGDFTIPVTYTVERGAFIPGTNVGYVGAKTGGAEFTNLDQFPYRERFDSVVWQGHLRERIALRLDLRVLDFNDDRAILGGAAQVIFEP
ncbi:MAG: hypothetical protein HY741_24455 [Chloroflexi bacterium]|nr:hypothetical protein [Chloroflexota bacterium]